MGELAKIDSYKREVAVVETIEEVKLLTTKGEILAEMAKKLDIPIKGQNELGLTRLELEKKKRELIEQMFPKGNIKGQSSLKSRDTTLKDVGITKDESSDAKIIKEEEELVKEVIEEITKKKDIITPKKVAYKVRKKKRKIDKEKRQVKAAAITDITKNIITDISPGWHQVGNQFLYYGNNLDDEFINKLPYCKFGFADPPYNAEVADWDYDFKWKHDLFIDKCNVFAVTPGGWESYNFYRQTNMPYIWEIICYITNGMTHGKCGFANYIKASIFSKAKVRISQDLFTVTIKNNTTGDTNHKGRKPYEFMIELINIFSVIGDKIFDLFAGSGTTLLMAEKSGRISYNAEIDKQFCIDIINRGIENELTYYGKRKL